MVALSRSLIFPQSSVTSFVSQLAIGIFRKADECCYQVAALGLTLFVGGLGLGPLFVGPLSEFYGRLPVRGKKSPSYSRASS
jgi:hypothetical protein